MDVTRFLIETAVNKALADISRDPERGIRNIVDMAAGLSNGRFQRQFLRAAQALLLTPGSAYYQVAKRLVHGVDHAAIRGFGINLGYSALTRGAKEIRLREASLGANVPWVVSVTYAGEGRAMHAAQVDKLIREGKALGIYAYCIYLDSAAFDSLLDVLAAHEDCAFFVFLIAGVHRPDGLEALMALANVMICVDTGDAAYADCCKRLRAARRLFSAYRLYGEKDIAAIGGGAWAEAAAGAGCIFAMLVPGRGCPPWAQAEVAAYVRAERTAPVHPVFVVDLREDLLAIDRAISTEACALYLDADGQAFATGEARGAATLPESFADAGLLEMLKRMMPRTQQAGAAAP